MTTAPNLSTADFTRAMQALLPTGKVWPRDLDAIITKAIQGLSPTYEANLLRANNLLVDSFPGLTTELLPEWEESLGLPDPCAGPAPTVLQRRAQVVARFATTGGQTAAYFIALALQLGYVITITEFAPWRFGDTFGLPLYGDDWAYAWQINAALYGEQFFEFGLSSMGDPFATFGDAVLECELNRVKPADTILIFSYT